MGEALSATLSQHRNRTKSKPSALLHLERDAWRSFDCPNSVIRLSGSTDFRSMFIEAAANLEERGRYD